MEKSMEKINSTIFDLELKLIKGKIDLVRLYDLNKGEEVILQEIIILQDHITSGFYYSTLDTGFIKCKEELLKLITLEELNHLLDLQTKLSNLKMENNLKGVFRDVASLKKFKQYAWICSKAPDFKAENCEDANILQDIIYENYFQLGLDD